MTRPVRSLDRAAAVLVLLATLTLLVVSLAWHRTPLYGVETDLLGDTVPAVRALREGRITPDTFLFRGPGYPLLVAGASLLTGGDEFLAARLINVAASAAAAAMTYLLFRSFLGAVVGLATVVALLANAVFVRAAIEAGTDMPALALALAATWLAISTRGWRASAAAGLLAGCACMTRYNTLFLVPAAMVGLVAARVGTRRLLAYIVGLAVPVAGWILVHGAITGEPPRNLNYLNIAYEVYGRGIGYDRFAIRSQAPFDSFLDVVRYDPAHFTLHILRNVFTRWMTDAQQLMPVWIGALALPGMVATWWRRPAAFAFTLHFALAYLGLTLVFYSPRFFLYLLPFYLSGTFGLLLRAHLEPAPDARSGRSPGAGGIARWMGWIGLVVAAAQLVASAALAVREARHMLADPPYETRLAGELLRTFGRPGERVVARKPHVAYFAGMDHVPMPYEDALIDFLKSAAGERADYLFISSMEVAQHPPLSVLADSGASLPGLVPLAHRALGGSHTFTLYRRVPTDAPVAMIEESLLVAIRRFATRRPGQPWPQTHLGGHLVTMGRYREALDPLTEAQRLDPGDALVARFQGVALAGLGEYDLAAAAFERALSLPGGGTWERGYLGHIRFEQGRYVEARRELERALRGEPANTLYLAEYLKASALGGEWQHAVAAAEQLLRLVPGDATARLWGARAWLKLGRPDRARTLAEAPGSPSGPDARALAAFIDSLRKYRAP